MKFTLLTDVGRYRAQNEDAIKVLQNDQLTVAILCDGMGGHNRGDLASNLAIKAFEWIFNNEKNPKDDPTAIAQWFSKGVKKALILMKLEAKDDKEKLDMGTTLVAFFYYNKSQNSYFFNIGDSRAYVFNGLLTQITRDQNHLQYLMKYEHYSEFEAKYMPGAQALLSSLGPNKICTPDIYHLNSPFKYIMLSSDGIHDSLTKPFIEKVFMESTSIEKKAQKLLNVALDMGSRDNLSIIILENEI